MHNAKRLMLLISFFLIGAYSLAHSAAPPLINYQGYLKQAGVPVNGAVNMKYELFDASSGGSSLCTAETASVTVTYGRFNHQIGSGTCNLAAIDWPNKTVYLELTLTTPGVTFAREQITSSGYALGSVDKSGDTMTGQLYTNAGISSAGNITAATSTISATAGSFSTSLYTATATLGGDIILAGSVTAATGTITAGKFVTPGIASAAFFIGDGSALTNLPLAGGALATAGGAMTGQLYTNVGISSAGNITAATSTISAATGSFSSGLYTATATLGGDIILAGSVTAATGTITAGAFSGNGAALTGTLDTTKLPLTGGAMSGALTVNNNITATGTVTAAFFSGDGAALINLPVAAGAVAKTGDPMTGSLTINAPTATDTLAVGNTGAGNAARFSNTSTSATLVAGKPGGTGNIIELQTGAAPQFVVDTSGNTYASGTITAVNFSGNGSGLTGVVATGALALTGGTMSGALVVNSNITATGTISAANFSGNGAGLTGVNASDTTKVAKTGDTMTGALNVNSNITATGTITAASFTGDGSGLTGVVATGALPLTGGTMSGALIVNNNITATGTVTAANFSGNGAGLTGVNASDTTKVSLTGDTMTGALIVNNNITATGTISAATFSGNGAGLTGVSASDTTKVSLTGDTMTGALVVNNNITATGTVTAANFSGNGAGLTGVNASDTTKVSLTGDTMTGALVVNSNITATGTITAASFAGDGSGLTGVVATGALALTGGTMSGALIVNNNITATGTITAANFSGNGAGLTGVNASDSTKVSLTGDTMTGALIVNNNITATGTISTTADISAATGTFTAALDTPSLTATAAVFTGSLTAATTTLNGHLGAASATFSTNVTAAAFFGDGAGLTGVTATGALPLAGGALTGPLSITNNATSTAFTVANASTLGNAGTFDLSSATNTSSAVNITTAGSGPALYVNTTGSGPAAAFNVSNTGNASAALKVDSSGAGNLIELTASGTPKFYIDNTGSAFASGSLTAATATIAGQLTAASASFTNNVVAAAFYGDGANLSNLPVAGGAVAKAGDTMTGALAINADLTVATNTLYVDSTNSRVGIGTATPGAILPAKLELKGANGNIAGPHLQVFTTDNYPLLQQLNWGHDNISFGFDSYYDGATWRSSYAGSNFMLTKFSDIFEIAYDSANAQGNAITWEPGFVMRATGSIGIGTLNPAERLEINGGNLLVSGNITAMGNITAATGTITAATGTFTSLSAVNTPGNINASGSLQIGGNATAANIFATGYASATTYYGDGSNLSNITATDNTKVAKTGDTMSGGLIVNFNSATAALSVDNNGGGGHTAVFTSNNATSTIYAQNTVNGGDAVVGSVTANGMGVAGLSSSNGSGVYGYNSSTGNGVLGANTGAGIGISGTNTGAGYAVQGVNSNFGSGTAGYFNNSNAGNTSSPLIANTAGTGNLIELKKGGSPRFAVDNAGNVFATGTTTAAALTSSSGIIAATASFSGNATAANIFATGYASATTYYGDGSNLTGVTATDNTKVAKTGDSLSGSLGIVTSASTAALGISNVGSGYAAYFSNSGATASVLALNNNNAGYGVYGQNTANGIGVYGWNGGTGYGVYGSNVGAGVGGYFVQGNAVATTPPLQANSISAANNLIELQKSGASRLYVDNNGAIFASGSVNAPSAALAAGITAATASFTGNATAAYFYGDGSNLSNVSATDNTKVAKSGDTMTGALIVNNDITATGTITAAVASITGNATAANIFANGYASATTYYGDGSNLTNVSATDNTKVAKSGDTMTGALTVNNDITATGAIAAATGTFAVLTSVNTPGNITASGSLLITGNATAAAFIGSGSGLTNVNAITFDGFATSSFATSTHTHTGFANLNITGNATAANIYATGFASATTYYGDGSNLSNVNATDNTKVAKTGDTMTGGLTINQNLVVAGGISAATGTVNSATGTFESITYIITPGNIVTAGSVTAATGTITAANFVGDGSALTNVYGTDTTRVLKTGDTMTGGLTINQNLVVAGGISAATGTVNSATGTFESITYITTPGNIVTAGSVTAATGTITAANFSGNGAGLTGVNASDTTKVLKTGDTMTGSLLMNVNSSTASLEINNTGGGYTAKLTNTNATATLMAENTSGGGGYGIYGSQNGSGSGVYSSNSGTGVLYGGNNTGAGGLIQLQSAGVDKFIVNEAGSIIKSNNIFASGSIFATGNIDIGGNATATNIFATGYASATTYYGDGSNLSNVTATDNSKVAKTGDTVTGSLVINANTPAASSTFNVTNTGGGYTASFTNTQATATVFASNSNASGPAIYGKNTGNGNALYGDSTGSGVGAYGQNNNVGYGVYGYNTGGGYGVYGDNSSFGGYGVFGRNTNIGSGYGVYGQKAGAGYGVYSENTGTGVLYGGNHTGASGNLLQLQNGGADTFVVAKDGALFLNNTITATGSITTAGNITAATGTITAANLNLTGNATAANIFANGYASATTYYGDGSNLTNVTATDNTKVLKTGDTMTGSLSIDTNASTSTLYVANSTGSGVAGRFYGGLTATSTISAENANTNGVAIYAKSTASAGSALRGFNTSTGVGVYGESDSGNAGLFSNTNNANSSSTLNVTSNSNLITSSLIYGNHSGASGNLITLNSGGALAFNVDKSGNVNASGTLYATGTSIVSNGYLNFGILTGNLGYGIRDNLGTIEYKNFAGVWTALGSGSYVETYGGAMTGSLVVNSNSATASLEVNNIGGGGVAAHFTNNQATATVYAENTSAGAGLYAQNSNTGVAAYIANSAVGNSTATLVTETAGSGNLIESRKNSAVKFAVDNSGNIFASGSLAAATGTFTALTSVDTTGSINASGSLKVLGSATAAYVFSVGYVSAATYYGDGSNLTGVTASDNTKVFKTGDTMSGSLVISAAAPAASASFAVSNTGGGYTGYFTNTMATATVYADASNGAGTALYGKNTGAGSGYGVIGNANGTGSGVRGINTSSGVAVSAQNNSTGKAAYFFTSNAGNATATLAVETAGTGNLIELYKNGGSRFYVDNSGNAFATGAVTADGGFLTVGNATAAYFFGDGSNLTNLTATDATRVSKTGDTMSGPLTMSYAAPAASATLNVTNSGGGGWTAFLTNDQATATLYSENTNASGIALFGKNTGGWHAVVGNSAGGDGSGVRGITSGAGPAISSANTGSGNGAYFRINNVANASAALLIDTNGSGNLMELQNTAASRFYVDNGGTAYASGGLQVAGNATAAYFFGDGSNLTGITANDTTKVAKTGDAITGSLTINANTSTSTLSINNSSPGATGKALEITSTADDTAFSVVIGAVGASATSTVLFQDSRDLDNSALITANKINRGVVASFTNQSINNATPTVYISGISNQPGAPVLKVENKGNSGTALSVTGNTSDEPTLIAQRDTSFNPINQPIVNINSANNASNLSAALNVVTTGSDSAAHFEQTGATNATTTISVKTSSNNANSAGLTVSVNGASGRGVIINSALSDSSLLRLERPNYNFIATSALAIEDTNQDTTASALDINMLGRSAAATFRSYDINNATATVLIQNASNNANATGLKIKMAGNNGSALGIVGDTADAPLVKLETTNWQGFSTAVLVIDNDRTSSQSSGLYSRTTGSAAAGVFESNAPGFATSTLRAILTNGNSGSSALKAENFGANGVAAYFLSNNTINSTATVQVVSNSDDPGSVLLAGDHDGTSGGYFLRMRNQGADKFAVDKNGNIFASGSLNMSSGMSAPLSVDTASPYYSIYARNSNGAGGRVMEVVGGNDDTALSVTNSAFGFNATATVVFQDNRDNSNSALITANKTAKGVVASFTSQDINNATPTVYISGKSNQPGIPVLKVENLGNSGTALRVTGDTSDEPAAIVKRSAGGNTIPQPVVLIDSSDNNSNQGAGLQVRTTGSDAAAIFESYWASNATSTVKIITNTNNQNNSALVVNVDGSSGKGVLVNSQNSNAALLRLDRQNYNSIATAALVIEDTTADSNYSALDISALAMGGGAVFRTLPFNNATPTVTITNASNQAGAVGLRISMTGNNGAALGIVGDTANGPLVKLETTNWQGFSTSVLVIENDRISAQSSGLYSRNIGTGAAGVFENGNPGPATNTLRAILYGNGASASAFKAETYGSNNVAAYFVSNHSTNSTATVQISSISDDPGSVLIAGDHDGNGGYLIRMRSFGADKFAVDKSGNIFASGSFTLGSGAPVKLTGDTMSGSLVINTNTATSSLEVTAINGSGGAAIFSSNGATPTVVIENFVNGDALRVITTSSGNSAARFENTNPANDNPAIIAITTDTSTATVYARSSATSNTMNTLYGGNHTGTQGSLINLQAAGAYKFNVDLSGNIYASGSLYASDTLLFSNAYLNFGATTGSAGYGVRDNAGAIEYKDNAGSWIAFNSIGGGSYAAKTGDTLSGAYLFTGSGASTATIDVSNASSNAGKFDSAGASTASVYIKNSNVGVGGFGLHSVAAGTNGSAVLGESSGSSTSKAVYGKHTGASGYAGYFENTNGANNASTLYVAGNGASTVVFATNTANLSTLYGGSSSGSGGAFLDFYFASGRMFYVDNTGALYASGTLYATGSSVVANGYMNFGPTTGSGGYGFRDNAGNLEWKNNGGGWASFGGGATSVAKSGDNMTGPLSISTTSATSSLYSYNNAAGVAVYGSSNSGSGQAARFEQLLNTNATDTVYITTPSNNAAGFGLRVKTSGTGAPAAKFEHTNGANNNPAVFATMSGATGTIFAENGSGNINSALYSGNHYGGQGSLIDLASGNQRKFVVDRSGNVYASSTLYATSTSVSAGGYMNFGGLSGAAGWGFRDNLGQLQVKAAPGDSWINFATSSTGASKTGDTLSGAYIFSGAGVSTATIDVSNASSMAGKFTSAGSSTNALYVENTNAGVGGTGIYAKAIGTNGIALYAEGGGTSSSKAIYGKHSGASGYAGYFENTNGANTISTVYAVSGAATSTIYAENTNAAGSILKAFATSSADLITVNNGGSGSVIYGTTSGTGYGGFFENTNAANANHGLVGKSNSTAGGSGLWGESTGSGPAIVAWAGSTGNALRLNAGNGGNTSDLLYGWQNGPGNLMLLQTSGPTTRLVVDNSGNIFASGSITAGCPAGTAAVGDFCVKTASQGASQYGPAVQTCRGLGMHLCTGAETLAACTLGAGIGWGDAVTYWVADFADTNTNAMSMNISNANCSAGNNPSTLASVMSTSNAFYCCKAK